MSLNRYNQLSTNEVNQTMPFITLDVKESDVYEVYKAGETRLDILADYYLGDPSNKWLIMMANPQFGGLEWNIPNNAIIRIPYPLDSTLNEFQTKINKSL